MRTLAQSLLQDYHARVDAVADLRTNVKAELNHYRKTQQAMSAEQEKALDQNMEALRREVAEAGLATSKFLQEVNSQHEAVTAEQRQYLADTMQALRAQVAKASQSTVDFMKEVDLERKSMNSEQRKSLEAQMNDLHNQVNSLRESAASFLGDLDKSNQSMAKELSQTLTSQRASLSTETATFRKEISSAHQKMSAQQARNLGIASMRLHKSVSDLRTHAAAALKASGDAHRSMAAQQKHSLAQDRSQLSAEVVSTRKNIISQRNSVRADLAEASQIWANISELKKKNRQIIKEVAEPVAAPSTPWEAVASVEAEVQNSVDDLQVIQGIGPGMAKHLADAGYFSYAQLADSSPEQVREALGKVGKLAKVESWIDQARELMK